MNTVPLWRVFPWDANAAEGDPFSAAFVPGGQGGSRFDLPGHPRGVIYLAESEEHAVAKTIQALRNSPDPLTNDDLTAWGTDSPSFLPLSIRARCIQSNGHQGRTVTRHRVGPSAGE